ncbi:Membrane-associated phospholipid phosphatase [Lentzea xinjiangensis]|uniref:Membrane-associated phospholipid phosphatase n=1 Tax=Lentzea xinjiangensis TaxID=402600 RepID=A0A1H9SJL0_9PSEU|nr:Membrane-associated phospholipid phosphatase [Lentzea xinjiangensis]
MAGSLLGFLFTYFALVWTTFGQKAENAALPEVSLQRSWASNVDMAILVAAVLVVLFARKKAFPPLLVLGGSVLLAQVLKLSVLVRPPLDDDAVLVHNSFPSGHTTAAVASVIAVTMAVPRRFALVVAVPGAIVAGAVAAEAVSLGWHRFSDTLGAALLVSTLAFLVLREWTAGLVVPPALAVGGVWLVVTYPGATPPMLSGVVTAGVVLHFGWVVGGPGRRGGQDRSRPPHDSVVVVGGDQPGDDVQSVVRSVPVGAEHHLVTVHGAEGHQTQDARRVHGFATVLADGDRDRLVGGGLRQQCGRPGVQSDLAGHGDPSLGHDGSSRRAGA